MSIFQSSSFHMAWSPNDFPFLPLSIPPSVLPFHPLSLPSWHQLPVSVCPGRWVPGIQMEDLYWTSHSCILMGTWGVNQKIGILFFNLSSSQVNNLKNRKKNCNTGHKDFVSEIELRLPAATLAPGSLSIRWCLSFKSQFPGPSFLVNSRKMKILKETKCISRTKLT